MSTYSFVAASESAVGVASEVIFLLLTSTVPIPFGTRLMFVLVPAAVIVTAVVLPIIKSVITFALEVMFPVAAMTPPVEILPPDTLPVAATAPPVVKFPPETLPVAATTPPVVILPPDTLPVAATTPPVVKLPPDTLPVADTTPPVVKLPPDTLPVPVSNVPAILAPVVVITNTLGVPPTEVVTLPPEVAIVTLLVPFDIEFVGARPVNR